MAEGVFVVAKPHCQRRAIVDLLGESRSGGVASMRPISENSDDDRLTPWAATKVAAEARVPHPRRIRALLQLSIQPSTMR